jgi:hypothetical protein
MMNYFADVEVPERFTARRIGGADSRDDATIDRGALR